MKGKKEEKRSVRRRHNKNSGWKTEDGLDVPNETYSEKWTKWWY